MSTSGALIACKDKVSNYQEPAYIYRKNPKFGTLRARLRSDSIKNYAYPYMFTVFNASAISHYYKANNIALP